jgi:hypothetical protein
MNKRDQELLDKQLWGVSSSPPHRGIIIGFIAVYRRRRYSVQDKASQYTSSQYTLRSSEFFSERERITGGRHDAYCHHLRYCVGRLVRRVGG